MTFEQQVGPDVTWVIVDTIEKSKGKHTMNKKGFTLIELLVVIAIIAVLMGILMPSLNMAREQARSLQCQGNVRTLTLAWILYTDENDGGLVPARPTGINQKSFVQTRITSFSPDLIEQEKEGIRQGLLYPLIKEVDVFRCPSDRRKNTANATFRSFAIAGGANGESWAGSTVGKKFTDIKSPATKYVWLAETDPRGFNVGSWVMNVQARTWVDPFSVWHTKHRTTLGWADGHVGMQHWVDNSTIEMCEAAIDSVISGQNPMAGFFKTVPAGEGEDVLFMAKGYPSKNN